MPQKLANTLHIRDFFFFELVFTATAHPAPQLCPYTTHFPLPRTLAACCPLPAGQIQVRKQEDPNVLLHSRVWPPWGLSRPTRPSYHCSQKYWLVTQSPQACSLGAHTSSPLGIIRKIQRSGVNSVTLRQMHVAKARGATRSGGQCSSQ